MFRKRQRYKSKIYGQLILQPLMDRRIFLAAFVVLVCQIRTQLRKNKHKHKERRRYKTITYLVSSWTYLKSHWNEMKPTLQQRNKLKVKIQKFKFNSIKYNNQLSETLLAIYGYACYKKPFICRSYCIISIILIVSCNQPTTWGKHRKGKVEK